jgi:hypothetical protein
MNCVLPFLTEGDHCQNLSWKYKPEIEYCGINYVIPYIILGETKGLPETLYQQQISVSLRDQTPSSMSNASTIVITFNPNVKVSKEEPSYNWFNFIVDVGSSFGTWVGISVISLIDFAMNPRAILKELFNC